MNTFEWEDGTVVERPYVEIDGSKHYVQDGTISGGTPASANNLNEMQNILNDNIEEKIDGRNYIAWRNSNPTQAFSAQQIFFNKSMYGASHYEIIYVQSKNASRMLSTGKIPNGYGTILSYALAENYYRAVNDDNTGLSITFENAYVANPSSTSVDNDRLIPYMVIFHYDNIW